MILPTCTRNYVAVVLTVLVLGLGACKGDKQQPAMQTQSHAGQGGTSQAGADQAGTTAFDNAPTVTAGTEGTPTANAEITEFAGAGGAEAGATQHTLVTAPATATLKVSGMPTTLQLTALFDGVQASSVNWSVDDVLLGVIDNSGNYRAFGNRAGTAIVTARVGSLTATTQITVEATLVDNAAQLSDDDMTLLRHGGTAEADLAWLYPYDGTVFPQGIGAPLMQFSGAAPTALYVRVNFSSFVFEGFYTPVGPYQQELDAGVGADRTKWPVRATFADNTWDSIVKSTKGKEDIAVSVTKLSAGKVTGPLTEHWRIANGELQGMVYYNTYNSAIPGAGGSIMRVALGGSFEPVKGQRGSDPAVRCTVCHSVSANGKVLAAAIGWSEEPAGKNSGNPLESASFDLSQTGSATLRKEDKTDGRRFAFGALSPEGDWMVTNGVPDVPLDDPRVRGLSGYDPDKNDDFVITPAPSVFIETATGAVLDVPSFTDKVKMALTPQFAPDGSALAFSWYDDSPGRTLGVVSVRGMQSPPQVGMVNPVLRSTTEVLAWPSFTPDSKGLLFHAGDGYDTNRHGGGASYAQVRMLDLDGNVVRKLDALNGVDAQGKVYLPYGAPGQEQDVAGQPLAQGTSHMNYEPNVLPVAIGGYYWVFFTSRRTYGNVIEPHGVLPLSNKPFGTSETSPRKKIWVAAVDIDFHGKLDPSHPAFYLPGQELGSGNMRAFAALAPCRANGDKCSSGVQCCDGFCRSTSAAGADPVLECVPPPNDSCANENESCRTTADCCDVIANQCINKRCARLTPD
jgi:hypothetical protein